MIHKNEEGWYKSKSCNEAEYYRENADKTKSLIIGNGEVIIAAKPPAMARPEVIIALPVLLIVVKTAFSGFVPFFLSSRYLSIT